MTLAKEKLALSMAHDDAKFFLEPVVASLLANGLKPAQIKSAVTASAERVLRASLTDRGLPVRQRTGVKLRVAKLNVEARRVAKTLLTAAA